MLGNLHVRFGVGAGVKLPGLHHATGSARNGFRRADCSIGRAVMGPAARWKRISFKCCWPVVMRTALAARPFGGGSRWPADEQTAEQNRH